VTKREGDAPEVCLGLGVCFAFWAWLRKMGGLTKRFPVRIICTKMRGLWGGVRTAYRVRDGNCGGAGGGADLAVLAFWQA